MAQKLAVELLMIELYESGYLNGNGNELNDILEKYKEIESHRIIKAFNKGAMQPQRMGTDYFDETYGDKELYKMTSENHVEVLAEVVKKETPSVTTPTNLEAFNQGYIMARKDYLKYFKIRIPNEKIEEASEKANGYAYFGSPNGEKYNAFKEGWKEAIKWHMNELDKIFLKGNEGDKLTPINY